MTDILKIFELQKGDKNVVINIVIALETEKQGILYIVCVSSVAKIL